MDFCPCGSKKQYDQCCLPIIKGEGKAKTAEQLMRSRYSAYAKQEIDHILKSYHPKKQKDADRKAIQKLAEKSVWLGLEIKETIDGGIDDNTGIVEFIARFKLNNTAQFMHERSDFQKIEGNWYYVDGESISEKQVIRSTKKIGRNDPCFCGSGKKYKKCCENKKTI
jgi:SEC-C motif-containing protein